MNAWPLDPVDLKGSTLGDLGSGETPNQRLLVDEWNKVEENTERSDRRQKSLTILVYIMLAPQEMTQKPPWNDRNDACHVLSLFPLSAGVVETAAAAATPFFAFPAPTRGFGFGLALTGGGGGIGYAVYMGAWGEYIAG